MSKKNSDIINLKQKVGAITPYSKEKKTTSYFFPELKKIPLISQVPEAIPIQKIHISKPNNNISNYPALLNNKPQNKSRIQNEMINTYKNILSNKGKNEKKLGKSCGVKIKLSKVIGNETNSNNITSRILETYGNLKKKTPMAGGNLNLRESYLKNKLEELNLNHTDTNLNSNYLNKESIHNMNRDNNNNHNNSIMININNNPSSPISGYLTESNNKLIYNSNITSAIEINNMRQILSKSINTATLFNKVKDNQINNTDNNIDINNNNLINNALEVNNTQSNLSSKKNTFMNITTNYIPLHTDGNELSSKMINKNILAKFNNYSNNKITSSNKPKNKSALAFIEKYSEVNGQPNFIINCNTETRNFNNDLLEVKNENQVQFLKDNGNNSKEKKNTNFSESNNETFTDRRENSVDNNIKGLNSNTQKMKNDFFNRNTINRNLNESFSKKKKFILDSIDTNIDSKFAFGNNNKDKKINNDNCGKNGPEEVHFSIIQVIQKGKKAQVEFEKK